MDRIADALERREATANGRFGRALWDVAHGLEVDPPCSLEAEQAVLGAVLIVGSAWEAVAGLEPKDFYRERHALIFEAMQNLWRRGEGLDALSVDEELRTHGRLDAVGGLGVVDSLAACVPSAGHARQYAEIIRRHARARQLLAATYEAQAAVKVGNVELAEERMREALS